MQAHNGEKTRALPFSPKRLLEWRPLRASPGGVRRRPADREVLIVFPLPPSLRPLGGGPPLEEEEELCLTLSLSTCPAGDTRGSFLSRGPCLSHTSKRGVKTAAEMKSKHLQVWEFPRRATKLPSLCPRSSAFTRPEAESASASCNIEFNLISDHKNSNSF